MWCCLWSVLIIAAVLLVIGLCLHLLSAGRVYSFKAKHVLITGGSSGIGKEIAIEALKRGADHVTLVARNKEKLQSTKSELDGLLNNQTVNVISLNVGDSDAEEQLKELLKDLPPVDILVNSAGITYTALFSQTSQETFQRLFETNVIGGASVTCAVLPSMIERNTGHIVFISSQAGQFPLYGYSAYVSTKYALRGLAEVLELEMKPYNVHISISFPPDTDTPQLQRELKDRSELVNELASYGVTLKANQVACEIVDGVERQHFTIYHGGFDGFMLSIISAGCGKVSSLKEFITQVTLMGPMRLVSIVCRIHFNRIIKRHVGGAKKTN